MSYTITPRVARVRLDKSRGDRRIGRGRTYVYSVAVILAGD